LVISRLAAVPRRQALISPAPNIAPKVFAGAHDPDRKRSAAPDGLVVGSLVGNKGYRRFLATPGDDRFDIDRAKAEEDAKFDGVFVLRTNADLSPLEAMLDPIRPAVIVDERDHGLYRRSSSAWAK
jgi:hypothetical protein